MIKVADVMTRDPVVIAPDVTVATAAAIMDGLNIGLLPVCDGRRLLGVVTDRDIAMHDKASAEVSTVSTVMTTAVRTCTEVDDLEHLEAAVLDLQVPHLPVIDADHHLIGVVHLRQLRHEPDIQADAAYERIPR